MALVSINITRWAADMLEAGKLNALIRGSVSAADAAALFHRGAMFHFYKAWSKEGGSILDLGNLLSVMEGSTKKQAAKMLTEAAKELAPPRPALVPVGGEEEGVGSPAADRVTPEVADEEGVGSPAAAPGSAAEEGVGSPAADGAQPEGEGVGSPVAEGVASEGVSEDRSGEQQGSIDGAVQEAHGSEGAEPGVAADAENAAAADHVAVG